MPSSLGTSTGVCYKGKTWVCEQNSTILFPWNGVQRLVCPQLQYHWL